MKIILDAMGGDNAPDAVVRGALEAAKEFGVQIVLVGRGADILASMKAQGWDTLPDGVELANAEDVVDMHCDPAAVVKQHPNSSLVLGARMLAQGGGDAFISAGNTGALLTAATLLVKRIRGIRRAAFSPVLPTKDGHAILIDAGANAECTPEFLLQFGCMGSFYAQKALGIESPRVGLLNNGAEDTKGDPLHREAHQLLKRAAEQGTIHFVGNVEARDVPYGAADVIVADGFSGNVLLKTMEGTAMFMSDMMKQMFYRNPLTMLGALLCKKGINGIHNIAEDARAAAAAALILAVSEQQMLAEREMLRHGGKALFADELRADARQITFELFGESPVQILRRHEADNGIPKEFQPLIAAQWVLIDLVCTGGVGQRHAQKLRIAELVAQRLFQLIQHVLPPWAGSSARYWHEFPRRSRSRPRGWPAGSRRGWRRRRTSRAP